MCIYTLYSSHAQQQHGSHVVHDVVILSSFGKRACAWQHCLAAVVLREPDRVVVPVRESDCVLATARREGDRRAVKLANSLRRPEYG